ncbi:uncharacterized protein LOC142344663 [Convolutriloba macropyga]|uniref:uncharacterized protein LOC142344663 n=1 Tax=Convolutriloba macropyga TaxID=536237 RepID=UPI003F5248C9
MSNNNNRVLPTFDTSTKSASMMLKNQNKSLKETRKQTNKLEQESKNMEERLNDLKVLLSRDRMERSSNASSASSANIWGSSGGGTSSNSATSRNPHPGSSSTSGTSGVSTMSSAPVSKSKQNQQKENQFPKRFKVLKDIPIDEPPKGPDQIMAYAKMMDRKPLPGTYVPRQIESNPLCPSCSKKHVTVICPDCQDYFCSMCFAKTHLKGEAKKHKSIPYDPDKVPEPVRQSLDAYGDVSNFTKDGIKFRNVEKSEPKAAVIPNNGIATEIYDEAASAASFQEALMEWRNSGSANQKAPSVTAFSTNQKSAATTNTQSVKKSVPKQSKAIGADNTLEMKTSDDVIAEFKFKEDSSLSYAEKLLLKKSYSESSRPASYQVSRASSRKDDGADIIDAATPRNEEVTIEMTEVRENINRFFSPKNSDRQLSLKSEIEITELSDNESCSDHNETTLCSVVEPDFIFEPPEVKKVATLDLDKPKENISNGKSDDKNNTSSTRTQKPFQTKNANSKLNNIQPKVSSTPISSKTPAKRSDKPKTPKTSARTSTRKSKNSKQEILGQSGSRPISAMSLTREPTMKLAEIAKLPKSGTAAPNSDLGNLFTLGTENSNFGRTEDHFTRGNSSNNISTSNLITIKKSKAPWRPKSSLQDTRDSQNLDPSNEQHELAKTELQNPAEDILEFENEIRLLENMGRESTHNNTNSHLTSLSNTYVVTEKPLNFGVETSLDLNKLSDNEDDNDDDAADEKTLDDLEYELACNTGRLNEDGSRMNRITEDLQGILNDMEMSFNGQMEESELDRTLINDNNEDEANEKFSLSINAEMEQDYFSNDEDDDLESVRNL